MDSYSDTDSSFGDMSDVESKNIAGLADLLWHKAKKTENETRGSTTTRPTCATATVTTSSPTESLSCPHGEGETSDRHGSVSNRENSSQPSPAISSSHQTLQFQISKLLKTDNKEDSRSPSETKMGKTGRVTSKLYSPLIESGMQKELKKIKKIQEAPLTTAQKKKAAKLQRGQWSLGSEQWGSMRSTELTEERKQDLMVLNMRSTIDPTRHYKHGDVKTPKFFQIGTVEEDPYNYYTDRIPKKKRKRTLVEELMADSDFKRKLKKQYAEVNDVQRKGKALFQGRAPRRIKKRRK